VRFVDEPTAVEVRFEADGTLRTRRFTWGQMWLNVSDVGRQWVDTAGRHVLVIAQASPSAGKHLVAARGTFELLLRRESLTWRIVRAPDAMVAA
jgi:hypothetical protein